MASLNKKAKQVVEKYDVSACTDITGFGLLGHGVEMAEASEVTLELKVGRVPYFADAVDYAKMGLVRPVRIKTGGIPSEKWTMEGWQNTIWIFYTIRRPPAVSCSAYHQRIWIR